MALLEGWYLVIFIILVVFAVMKVINAKQNAATKIGLFLFLVLAVTIGYFSISSDLKVEGIGDIFDAGKVYFSWMGSVIGNVIQVTSNAIHMDWSGNLTRA